MNKSKLIYYAEQLPDALKPICKSNDSVSEGELLETLSSLALSLYAVECMRDPNTKVEPLDAYRFGTIQGYASLSEICNKFHLGIDDAINASHIRSMHNAAQPFFTHIIKLESVDTTLQAQELLKAQSCAYNYFTNLIVGKPILSICTTLNANDSHAIEIESRRVTCR